MIDGSAEKETSRDGIAPRHGYHLAGRLHCRAAAGRSEGRWGGAAEVDLWAWSEEAGRQLVGGLCRHTVRIERPSQANRPAR